MEEKIAKIISHAQELIDSVSKEADLMNVKSELLGKKSETNDLLSSLKDMSVEDKKIYGSKINDLKNTLSNMVDSKLNAIKEAEFNEKLSKESIDVTLNGTNIEFGAPNILDHVIEEVEAPKGHSLPEKEDDRFTLIHIGENTTVIEGLFRNENIGI